MLKNSIFLACLLTSSLMQIVIGYTYRPQYHYSPPKGWLSDPNGLVYYKKEYHLFYQSHPQDSVPGARHWSHAVSTDLITWTFLGTPIAPDTLGTIMSGSAVVDTKNTAEFKPKGPGGNDVIIAMFTHYKLSNDHQVQSIAYSTDKGTTFTKYSGNPVIPNPKNERHIRDPKVIRYGNNWILALAVGDVIRFYSSPDMKTWKQLSEFGIGYGSHDGVWECPDLFPLKHGSKQLWVLIVSIDASRPVGGPNKGSATQYFIGSFDGKQFTTKQKEALWLDWGPDNYAIIAFNGMTDGKVVVMGWLSNWKYCSYLPTQSEGWTGQMTIPRYLSLKSVNGHPRLVSKPVVQTSVLHKNKVGTVSNTKVGGGQRVQVSTGGNHLLHIKMVLNTKGLKSTVNVCFSNAKAQEICVGYDPSHNQIQIDRLRSGNEDLLYYVKHIFFRLSYAKREVKESKLILEMFLDSTSLEVFADEGVTNMAALFFPDEPFTKMDIRHTGPGGSAPVTVVSAEVWSMHNNPVRNGARMGSVSHSPPNRPSPAQTPSASAPRVHTPPSSSSAGTSKPPKPKSGGFLGGMFKSKPKSNKPR